MATVPKWREMRVPLVSEGEHEILQVTVIRRADDEVTAGPKQPLSEPEQVARSNQVLDYLCRDCHIKGLVADRRSIIVHSDLVKHQRRRGTLRVSNAVSAVLTPDYFVSTVG